MVVVVVVVVVLLCCVVAGGKDQTKKTVACKIQGFYELDERVLLHVLMSGATESTNERSNQTGHYTNATSALALLGLNHKQKSI